MGLIQPYRRKEEGKDGEKEQGRKGERKGVREGEKEGRKGRGVTNPALHTCSNFETYMIWFRSTRPFIQKALIEHLLFLVIVLCPGRKEQCII